MATKTKCFLIYIFLVLAAPLHAQKADPNSFDRWYRLVNLKIAPNGAWNLFYKMYDSGKTEAVLLNTVDKTENVYDDPVDFYRDNERFMLLTENQNLQIKALPANGVACFDSVTAFRHYAPLGSTLILKKQQLQVLDRHLNVVFSLDRVDGFRTKNDPRFAFLKRHDQPSILDLKQLKLYPVPLDPVTDKLVYEGVEGEKVFVLVNRGVRLLLCTLNEGLITEQVIPYPYETDMRFDIKNGTLTMNRPYHPAKDSIHANIEIWDSSAVVLPPKLQRFKDHAKIVDFIDLNRMQRLSPQLISDDRRPVLLSGGEHILWVSDLENESFRRDNVSPLPGLQLINLKTQHNFLTVEEANLYYVVREKNALLYFSRKDWWIYDLSKKKNTNITKGLGTAFYTYDRMDTHFPNPLIR